mmetsp:Transcript_12303/g.16788  ORF Transcript_12303/g.16788 Transcript_12303/m.16788 type:complete len:134 (+) Transcript_12303:3-404(+)
MTSKYDVIKILVLCIIWSIGIFSGFNKFFLNSYDMISAYSNYFVRAPSLEPDYTDCLKASITDVSLCKSQTADAFRDADIKCRGFINNLKSCSSVHHNDNNCHVEKSNLAHCISTVTTGTLSKWKLSNNKQAD